MRGSGPSKEIAVARRSFSHTTVRLIEACSHPVGREKKLLSLEDLSQIPRSGSSMAEPSCGERKEVAVNRRSFLQTTVWLIDACSHPVGREKKLLSIEDLSRIPRSGSSMPAAILWREKRSFCQYLEELSPRHPLSHSPTVPQHNFHLHHRNYNGSHITPPSPSPSTPPRHPPSSAIPRHPLSHSPTVSLHNFHLHHRNNNESHITSPSPSPSTIPRHSRSSSFIPRHPLTHSLNVS